MPQVGAAVAALATAIKGSAVAMFVVKAIGAIALSFAVGKLTARHPKSQLGDNTVTVRQPAFPRRLIYGQVRTGGVLAYMQSTHYYESAVRAYSAVVPAAPHAVVLPGEVLSISFVEVRFGDGDNVRLTQVPSAPGPGQYSVSGSTLTFNAAETGKNIRVWYTVTQVGAANRFLHMVIVLAAHEVEEIGDIYFDNDLVPVDPDGYVRSGKYAGGHINVFVRKFTGSPNQQADPDMIAQLEGKWSTAHRLRGHAYIWVRLWASTEMFPNGAPNITAVVKGKKDILDPRVGLRRYTANAALCIADYLLDKRYGFGADNDSEIDADALIEAANICDESVPLAGGGTEKRYTCGGVIDTANTLEDNISLLATSLGALPIYTSGRWYVRAAAYDVPTITIDESDARGPLRVVPTIGARDSFNAVKGVYVSPNHFWQPTDYPAVTNALYEGQDGERNYRDLELPFTTSASMAQRLAKIELEKNRLGMTVQFPMRLSGMRLRPGSTVKVNNSRFGWNEKVFEVLDWEFEHYEDETGGPTLGTLVTLKETAPEVYDWNSGEETIVDPAPNTNLPSPFDIGQPGMLPPVEELYETREGAGVRVKVFLACTVPAGEPERYRFEYKLVGDAFFTSLAPVDVPEIELRDMAPGVYDFRVCALNRFGVSSLWSQIRYEVKGLTVVPADITGLTMQAISAFALLQWHQHPDLDVRRGGRIHVRHTEAMSGQQWDESYSVVDPIPGDASSWIAPLKAGSYGLRAEDSGGRLSPNAVWIATKDASVLEYSTIATVQEDPAFPGAKDGVVFVVGEGGLMLAGQGSIDDIPDIDEADNIDAFGGIALSGTYTFDTGIDLGAVKRVRLVTEIALQTVSALDLIDSRSDNIDDWADFDGAPAAGVVGDCVIEVRETDDDPSAPDAAWSDWKRLTSADYEARAFKARARLSVNDPAFNVHVTKLRLTAKEIV